MNLYFKTLCFLSNLYYSIKNLMWAPDAIIILLSTDTTLPHRAKKSAQRALEPTPPAPKIWN
jgi:hypothetical protein